MDRQIVFPGAIPLETDILNSNKYAMVGMGMLALDILGSGTAASGLACTPTLPASLNVQIAPGRIYSLQNVDNTAYSSLPVDTAHQILKQGILPDVFPLGCAAPSTFGFSVNYLIQAAYQDSDTNLVTLPYYNASNPSQALSGPNNSGTAQATTRSGTVVVSAKPGIAATTGTQTTPAPDAGAVGLYVVTVANGQSTITSANIKTLAAAPFISGGFSLVVTGPFNAPVTTPINYTKVGKTVNLFLPNTLGVASAVATNVLTSAAGSIPANLIPFTATAAFSVNPIGAFYAATAAMYTGTGAGTAGFAAGEAGRAGIDSVGVFQITKPSNWSTISGSINGFSAFTLTYQTAS